jgi:methionine-rich copper-binding protein CopC
MRRSIVAAAATLAFAAAGGTAWAHAHLKTASPAPDSTVQAAPDAVTIDFTEGVEPRFSNIEVQDATGHRVDKGSPATAPGNNQRFSVGVQSLPPGTYKVIWHATAVDTHKTDGTFQFTVRP